MLVLTLFKQLLMSVPPCEKFPESLGAVFPNVYYQYLTQIQTNRVQGRTIVQNQLDR